MLQHLEALADADRRAVRESARDAHHEAEQGDSHQDAPIGAAGLVRVDVVEGTGDLRRTIPLTLVQEPHRPLVHEVGHHGQQHADEERDVLGYEADEQARAGERCQGGKGVEQDLAGGEAHVGLDPHPLAPGDAHPREHGGEQHHPRRLVKIPHQVEHQAAQRHQDDRYPAQDVLEPGREAARQGDKRKHGDKGAARVVDGDRRDACINPQVARVEHALRPNEHDGRSEQLGVRRVGQQGRRASIPDPGRPFLPYTHARPLSLSIWRAL